MSEASYVDPILEYADRDPGRRAVTGAVELTYGDLLGRARDLASRLVSAGCLPGDGIALIAGRNLAYLVGMLGIAIAGGAAVPIAADEPPLRRARLLRHLPLRAVVTGDAAGDTRIDQVEPDAAPSMASTRGALHGIAYVLFTSGSTGTPRPVAMGHAALRRYLQWAAETLVRPEAPMPVLSAPSFDAIFKQALAPLVRGSAVLLLSDQAARSPGELARLLTDSTTPYTVNCVPSFWRAVLAEVPPATTLAVQRLLLGGEAVDQAVIAGTRVVAPQAEIWNLYGPTEAAANATAAAVGEGGLPRLGTALPYATVYVLDPGLQAAGDHETGEIYIGGCGLAAGYLGDPRATAERFVPDPFSPGARMFRTGDLASRVDDGLVFGGRADRQLKRRGVRVEPAEIESALREHPQVRDAAVAVVDVAAGQPRLAVVVEPVAAASPTSDELRGHLRLVLHPAAVPDIIVPAGRLPRTPSGKPDHRRIAGLCQDLVATSGPTAAGPTAAGGPDRRDHPADPLQAVGCAVWAGVLGVQVTPDDNFFEIGGHSIAMLRITGRLSRLLDLDLGVGMLYDTPTVAQQAAEIRQCLGAEADQRARKAMADLGTC